MKANGSSGEKSPTTAADASNETNFVIEEDRRKTVKIVDGECPDCEYDRLKVTIAHHGDAIAEECMACGHHRVDGSDWQRPETTFDRLRDMREYAENEDNSIIEKLGEIGRRSFYFHGTEVFEYTDTGVVMLFEHPSSTETTVTSIKRDDLRSLVQLLERDDGFLTELLQEEYHKLDRLVLAAQVLPDEFTVESDEEGEADA